jgi:phage shock protein B
MIHLLLTNGLFLANLGLSAAHDSLMFSFWITIVVLCFVFAPRILRELRKWRRPEGVRKEDLATLKRISEMLDKMEARVDALEVILSDRNRKDVPTSSRPAEKLAQPNATQIYGPKR